MCICVNINVYIYLSAFVITDDDCNVDKIFHKTGERASEKTGSKPDTRDGVERKSWFMMPAKLDVRD